MSEPYGLHVVDSCLTCKMREDRLFCNLSRPALEELQRIKFSASYPAGSVLFMEGQPAQSLLILCQGKVKLSVSSPEGKTVILSITDPGEVLGLSSVISGKPHETTAEAVEPVQVNAVKRADFLNFLQKFQDVSVRAAQELSQVHNTACRELRILGLSQSVTEKLATLLLQWDEKAGPARHGRVTVALTHEEIAQFLGTSRETITRTLNDFKKKKIISVKGASLQILDRGKLENLAGAVPTRQHAGR